MVDTAKIKEFLASISKKYCIDFPLAHCYETVYAIEWALGTRRYAMRLDMPLQEDVTRALLFMQDTFDEKVHATILKWVGSTLNKKYHKEVLFFFFAKEHTYPLKMSLSGGIQNVLRAGKKIVVK